MIALAIIALGLAAALTVVSESARNAMTLRDRTYASWIGQNTLTEIRLAGTLPDLDITSGEVEFAQAYWTWEAEVTETGVDNLRRVDVRVYKDGGEYAVREVTGFVGQPSPPGLASAAWAPIGESTETRQ